MGGTTLRWKRLAPEFPASSLGFERFKASRSTYSQVSPLELLPTRCRIRSSLRTPPPVACQAHLALVIHIVEILAGSGFRALALCVGDTFVPTAGPSSLRPRQD